MDIESSSELFPASFLGLMKVRVSASGKSCTLFDIDKTHASIEI